MILCYIENRVVYSTYVIHIFQSYISVRVMLLNAKFAIKIGRISRGLDYVGFSVSGLTLGVMM
jgi:hypothetical protein